LDFRWCRTPAIIIPVFILACRKVRKGNREKFPPVICVLTDAIMQSVENALLIGEISFVMMLLRGQACRWGTGSHMKAGSCLFLGKKQNWQEGRSSLHTALRETVIRGFHGRITRTIRECHLSDPLSERRGNR